MAQETLYVDKNSLFHRFDPRSKVVWVVSMWIGAIVFNHPLWTFVIFLFTLTVAYSAKILSGISFIFPGLKTIFSMAIIIWPLFVEGTTILRHIGPITIYYESLLYSIAIGFRLVSMVLAGMVLLATTRVEDLAIAFRKMKIPYSVIFGVTMVFRFFPTMLGEANLITSAAKARGVKLESGHLLEKVKKRVAIMSPLMVTMLRRVNDLSKAIESRGFNARKERTFLYTQVMHKKDWVLLLFSLLAMIGFLFLRLELGMGVVIPGRI